MSRKEKQLASRIRIAITEICKQNGLDVNPYTLKNDADKLAQKYRYLGL